MLSCHHSLQVAVMLLADLHFVVPMFPHRCLQQERFIRRYEYILSYFDDIVNADLRVHLAVKNIEACTLNICRTVAIICPIHSNSSDPFYSTFFERKFVCGIFGLISLEDCAVVLC